MNGIIYTGSYADLHKGQRYLDHQLVGHELRDTAAPTFLLPLVLHFNLLRLRSHSAKCFQADPFMLPHLGASETSDVLCGRSFSTADGTTAF